MSSELSKESRKLFEELKQTVNGVECWDARVLMPHVGYANWQDFHEAIKRAIQSCITNGESVEKHFLGTSLKNTDPKGRGRPGKNYLLTRRACYLVFQNGDPKIDGIAAAQAYFVQQTMRQEFQQKRAKDHKRITERNDLTLAEDVMTKVTLGHDVTPQQLATIRSNGDSTFFGGNKTSEMKKKLGVPEKRALADFLAIVLVNAKATAAGITAHNTQSKDLYGYKPINKEHVQNNKTMRDLLVDNGVVPETQPAETDIRQVYVRLGISRGPKKPMAEGQTSLLGDLDDLEQEPEA